MNEFTKEELKRLLNLVRFDQAERGNGEAKEKLKEKLQSMIENYCEHPVLEPGVTGYKCMGCKGMFSDNQ